MKTILGVAAGLALGVALAHGLSCAALPSPEACDQACAAASRCGLLPSALGGAVGQTTAQQERDCVARCAASDTTRRQVAGLLDVLGRAALDDASLPLCEPEGMRECEALLDALEHDLDTSELVVSTDLTIRMVSMAGYVAGVSLASWCCFDYLYELDHESDDEVDSSEDIDELAVIYDMLEPTGRCIDGLQEHAITGLGLAMGTPEQPADPAAAAAECQALGALWAERPPELPVDVATDPCHYARMSGRMRRLDIEAIVAACEPGELDALAKELGMVREQWGFRAGMLLDESAALLDIEGVRTALESEIRKEITRPGGALEGACTQLLTGLTELPGPAGPETLAEACEALDREALVPTTECLGGPLCSRADCVAGSEGCDASLCDAELPPPGRDCGLLSITDVRLGYRDAQGLEVLGEPLHGCEALPEVITTFEDVAVGNVVPIAVVSGTLPSSAVPHDLPVSRAGPFSWIVEGHVRWVTAGATELELPSPLLDQLLLEYDDPLEVLGWVPRRLPTSQACASQPLQCEGYFNDNCDNGIDDDGDGLADEASAWCDPLYRELVARCVVTEPGRGPPAQCSEAAAP